MSCIFFKLFGMDISKLLNLSNNSKTFFLNFSLTPFLGVSSAVSSASNAEALSLGIFACALLSKTQLVFSSPFSWEASPHPQLILRSATSGTFREFWQKRRRKKIGFYFLTYEWSRRRLSLIKMINGAEVALILLFTAFRYEYLFEVPSYAFE